ncbi:MAG: hypothetical protein Q8K92_02660, partial [Leadbetterella sp.]|nr:hypothetical protein [Leadbetterella sp.]
MAAALNSISPLDGFSSPISKSSTGGNLYCSSKNIADSNGFNFSFLTSIKGAFLRAFSETEFDVLITSTGFISNFGLPAVVSTK